MSERRSAIVSQRAQQRVAADRVQKSGSPAAVFNQVV